MTAIPQFDASFDRLFSSQPDEGNPAFFHSFYARFRKHEGIAEMFRHTDADKQVRMLKRSIFDLVGFYVTGSPSAELYRLAHLHKSLGIDASLLDAWLAALLETVCEYDPQANEEVRLAWMAALSPGLTYIRLELVTP